MKNIITIQHTQSEHHVNGMIGSQTEWGLTELGKQQAENIGKSLAEFIGGTQYVMYSSNQIRARQTAEIVGKHLKIEPILEELLREQSLGEAIGKSVEWAHENTIVWMKKVDDRPFSGAETHRETWHRVMPFVKHIAQCSEENIIIVSHGVTLSFINAIWLGLEVEDLNRCGLSGLSGGVSFLSENADGRRLIRRLSDMSFINGRN
jgi:Fructose-2,6-bisphosphatase